MLSSLSFGFNSFFLFTWTSALVSFTNLFHNQQIHQVHSTMNKKKTQILSFKCTNPHTMLKLFCWFLYSHNLLFICICFSAIHLFHFVYCAVMFTSHRHTLFRWFSFYAHLFAHVDYCAKVIKHDFDLVTLDEDRVLLFTRSFAIQKQFGRLCEFCVCVWLFHSFFLTLYIQKWKRGKN